MAKPISDAAREKIAFFTNSMVATYFAIFSNPKNRGSNFKWENFSEMMGKQAVRDMHIHTQINKPEHIAEGVELAKKEANRLVKLMTE